MIQHQVVAEVEPDAKLEYSDWIKMAASAYRLTDLFIQKNPFHNVAIINDEHYRAGDYLNEHASDFEIMSILDDRVIMQGSLVSGVTHEGLYALMLGQDGLLEIEVDPSRDYSGLIEMTLEAYQVTGVLTNENAFYNTAIINGKRYREGDHLSEHDSAFTILAILDDVVTIQGSLVAGVTEDKLYMLRLGQNAMQEIVTEDIDHTHDEASTLFDGV